MDLQQFCFTHLKYKNFSKEDLEYEVYELKNSLPNVELKSIEGECLNLLKKITLNEGKIDINLAYLNILRGLNSYVFRDYYNQEDFEEKEPARKIKQLENAFKNLNDKISNLNSMDIDLIRNSHFRLRKDRMQFISTKIENDIKYWEEVCRRAEKKYPSKIKINRVSKEGFLDILISIYILLSDRKPNLRESKNNEVFFKEYIFLMHKFFRLDRNSKLFLNAYNYYKKNYARFSQNLGKES
ncbi:MAG: hypothetical protein N4A44_04675 [Alphaproteobacteria bacterium]|jgi:hypothetical protein|nr:hypothetical protein [Alphaproteobacteria bacterium]